MLLDDLIEKKLINPPQFLRTNTMYMTIMGSHAYGVADTSDKTKMPDYDIYGFAIPPKDYIFPALRGEIAGFGKRGPTFDKPWQQHHVIDKEANGGYGKEWDFQIANIVRYFELCRNGNPNWIDSLFTPVNCVIHSTAVGQLVRDNRKLFISKKVWATFRGYAFSNIHKTATKNYVVVGKFEHAHKIPVGITLDDVKSQMFARKIDLNVINDYEEFADVLEEIELRRYQANLGGLLFPEYEPTGLSLDMLSETEIIQYFFLLKACPKNMSVRKDFVAEKGSDTKLMYHLFRLLDEVEQLLQNGEMDLQRGKDAMKAIRRGDWKEEDLIQWAQEKEHELDIAFTNCKLPDEPDEMTLKKLLLECLEMHYGSLEKAISLPGQEEHILRQIAQLVAKYN